MTRKLHDRMFPMAPLLEVADRVQEDNVRAQPMSKLARLADIHPSQLTVALGVNGGMLTVRQADEWAIRSGFHPWEIWGDQWFDPEAYEEGVEG